MKDLKIVHTIISYIKPALKKYIFHLLLSLFLKK